MGHLGILKRATVVACALVMVSTSTAQAEVDVLEGQPSIRNKQLYLEGRHNISVWFGSTVNDDYVHNLIGGLSYRYFLESWFGLGLDVAGGFGADTELTGAINKQLSLGQETFALSTSTLRLLLHATAEIVPFEGKFMIFGAEARIDFHLTLGVGVALAAGTGKLETEFGVMPVAGVGFRFFPSDWIAIGFDARDYIVQRVLASPRSGPIPGSEFGNNWLLSLSIQFFFPTEPEIRP